MLPSDIQSAVQLQGMAFPPPFSDELHWRTDHLIRHINVFTEGQFVAVVGGEIVGTCSNVLISESVWQSHGSWMDTVGGPFLENHAITGTTLYGVDITVAPKFRKIGIGRSFYECRYGLVQKMNLTRYGTACRIPDFKDHHELFPFDNPHIYAEKVLAGQLIDRTLTPLLRYGLTFIDVINDYMEDEESHNAAVLLQRLA